MDFFWIEKDGERRRATKRAYDVLYRGRGYVPVDTAPEKVEEKPAKQEKDGLSELKVEELREMAKEKAIPGYAMMKKAELIQCLKG